MQHLAQENCRDRLSSTFHCLLPLDLGCNIGERSLDFSLLEGG